MNNGIKKYVLIIFAIGIVVAEIPGMASAQQYSSGGTPNVKVSLLRYTPYPAEPGNYATLTFKIENDGSGDASNMRLKFVATYPFSLDAGTTAKIENYANPVPVDSSGIVSLGLLPASQYELVDLNVRVAGGALEGNNQLQIWHQASEGDVWAVDTFGISVQGIDSLEVSDVSPSVIVPGKPTDMNFTLDNSGTANIRNIAFTWSEKNGNILPLGSGSTKYVDTLDPHKSVQIPFTLVTSPGVASGAYSLNVNITYTIGSNISKSLDTNVGIFVGGSGDFDVSLQGAQQGSVSLSVANVGSTPTTSVSVSIPNQNDFGVSGPSTSFLGDLNPGDFTLATFQIFAKNNSATGTGTLKIDITYTDTNSNRQMVEKDVPVRFQDLTSAAGGGQTTGQAARSGSGGLSLVIFGIVGIVVVIAVIKYHGRIGRMIRRGKKTPENR